MTFDIPAGEKATLDLALRFHDEGDLTAAMAIYRALLQVHPDEPDIWGLLGSAERMTGDAPAAVLSLAAGVAYAPDRFDMKAELAIALSEAGRHAEAAEKLRSVLPVLRAAGQDAAVVYAALGDASLELEQYDDAIASYRIGLEKDPGNAAAAVNLGIAFCRSDRLDEAITTYRQTLSRDPFNVEALVELGAALQQAGQEEASLPPLSRAVMLAPQDATALTLLGVSLHRLGRRKEAEKTLRKAVNRDAGRAVAWSHLADILHGNMRLADALTAHDKALAAAPDDPGMHLRHAATLLLCGHLRAGFAELEWRRRRADFAGGRIAGPPWDGRDAKGRTILLYCEGSVGDAIQFSRYAPALALSGAAVILACPPPLAGLLGTLDGPIGIVSTPEDAPSYDGHAPLMSLPHFMHTTLDSIPARAPYLAVPPGAVSPLPSVGAKCRIGLAWANDGGNPADNAHALPPERLAPLFGLPDIEWIGLQAPPPAGAPPGPPQGPPPELPITDISARLDGLAETAAAIDALDLVIAVDGVVAHLAGALGRPVWLLLAHAPDWRWLTHRDDSPWYPTMRLFRQPRPGDWDAVISDVAAALQEPWLT